MDVNSFIMAHCRECNEKFPIEDLRDVGTGNTKKYVCDNCYEEKYAGNDDDDNNNDGFLGVGFDYTPGDPFW